MNTKIVSSKFDLSVTVSSEEHEFTIGWEYSISLFNKETIERMAQHYVKENEVVGIIAERSIEIIIEIYGIFKLGAAYMPIDPGHPLDRVNYMLSQSNVKVVLTGK